MGKRILVVDDDPVVGVLVTEFLTPHGYEVTVRQSGGEGLSQLKEALPDILIVDLMMPDMTGIDVLRAVRADPQSAQLPVIMLSANNDQGQGIQGYDVQPDRYVEKPFKVPAMLQAIKELGG